MKKLSLNLVDYDKNGNPNLHGLNWGNRKDGTERDKNEAYLQLTPEIYSTDYFPPKGKYFITETDDGETLILVRAQKPIGTALQTPENNAILGRYLRKRLGLEEDEEITAENVEAYRTTISFYKKDDLHYFLDYSKNDESFLERDFNKIYKDVSRKETDENKIYLKIKQKLYQKGYKLEQIDRIINEKRN